MMIGKRIGKWSWALSPDERMTAARVDQAHAGRAPIGVKLQRAHDAMIEKQRKLTALGQR